MKDTTRQGWKKFGWLCLSAVPMISYLLLMLVVTVGIYAVLTVFALARGETDITGYLLGYAMHCGIAYALLGLLLYGLWYYFGCKKKRLLPPAGVFRVKNILAVAAAALGANCVVSWLLALAQMLLPDIIENYSEMMEQAGIGDVTVAMVLYVVVLGPILEELIFRGLTFYYTKKFTKRFWLANVLQAVFFGIMHGNLVQGVYAFFLGLFLGWVYEKFQSLYATVWMHIVFNFLGSGILNVIFGEDLSLLFQIVWNVLGIALLAVGVLVIRKNDAARGA